jgi:hypothetical protein
VKAGGKGGIAERISARMSGKKEEPDSGPGAALQEAMEAFFEAGASKDWKTAAEALGEAVALTGG